MHTEIISREGAILFIIPPRRDASKHKPLQRPFATMKMAGEGRGFRVCVKTSLRLSFRAERGISL
jgi:hypothetical protein